MLASNATGVSMPTWPGLYPVARPLYADDESGVELDNTACALDASTINLCLSVFFRVLFRSTESAVKLHPLQDLRGNILTAIDVPNGKLLDVNVFDILGHGPWPSASWIGAMWTSGGSSHFGSQALSSLSIPIQYPVPTPRFQAGRDIDRREVRSGRRTDGRDDCQGLPATITSHHVSRREHRQEVQLSGQQLLPDGPGGCRAGSLPRRVELLLKWIKRHLHKEATRFQRRSLHDVADSAPRAC